MECYRPIIGKIETNKTDPDNPTLRIIKDREATMDDIDRNHQSIYFESIKYYDCVKDWKKV